jgi:6-phosphofructokinase 1
LTAASVMARKFPGDGPHLIYVPERSFDVDRFVADVDRVYSEHGRCLVAISEGVHDQDGTPIATLLANKVEKDAHGNVQLSGSGALGDFLSAAIKEKLAAKHGKLRVRADTFGYLQRSFPGVFSEVDRAEARAVGRVAAGHATQGAVEGSIAIRRTSNDPYRASFDLIQLKDVAGLTRVLPDDHIQGDNDISDAFKTYLAPLLGELPVVEQL